MKAHLTNIKVSRQLTYMANHLNNSNSGSIGCDNKCNGGGQHLNNSSSSRNNNNDNHTSSNSSAGSTISSNNNTNTLAPTSKVCRDYLRKVCRRGSRCKFVHINPNEDTVVSSPSGDCGISDNDDGVHQPAAGCGTAVSATQGTTQLTFCHDYQNNHCNRNCCKFIHCTCEEENQYLQTGHIPPHVLDQAIRKGQMADATLNGDIPICKDFLMGECEKRRGGKCKFRHLNQAEYHQEIYGYSTMNQSPVPQPPPHHHNSHGAETPLGDLGDNQSRLNGCGRRSDDRGGMMDGRPLAAVHPYDGEPTNVHHLEGGVCRGSHHPPGLSNDVGPPDHKRPRLDPLLRGYQDYHAPRDQDYGQDRDYVHGLPPDKLGRDMMASARDLASLRDYRDWEMIPEWERRGMEMTVMRKQMENMKKEINALKKENSDLRATNDFLLDKVTTLGASKLNGHVATSTTLASVSLATAPPSLVASTIPPLSAAAAQVTPVSHAIAIGPALSMALPQQTVAHPTIAAPPSIAPQSIAQASDCTVQAGVQHPLTNPLSITSISTDGSSVVAIATPPQPPPPTQPPQQPPPPQPLAPPQAVAVAAAPPTAAVVVSVGTVQVPLSQAAITITSGTLNPRITTSSMSMSLPSIATAPTIVPSIGQTIAAPPGPAVAAANIAQAISMSQGAPPISMSQGGPITMNAPPISMTAPPISMAGPPISMSGPPISMSAPPISMSAPQPIAISGPQSMSMSGAPGGRLLSYPIMSQQSLRTQLH
ncbi:Zinc finger CCCH-type [Trinorchestia longiramus]|nr:Zinc finger CCCH-type [Trinorchestia longiramus]